MSQQNILGRRILELRKGQKMTQGILAEKVGVSTNAISQFEKGGLQPSSETLARLSDFLGDELHIGKFPVRGTEGNTEVRIMPSKEEELAHTLSNTLYACKTLSLPPSILEPGLTRAFLMPGNAMEPSFGEGDLIIATQLQNVDWNTFPKESNRYELIDALPMCVVEIKKERSLAFGRCCVDASIKSLSCFSDRRGFFPYRTDLTSIKAIWEFKCFLSQRSQNPAQQFSYQLEDLQREVREIKAEAERYPRLKIKLRLLILEWDISVMHLWKRLRDFAENPEVRQYYELEVAPINQNEDGFADKLVKIIQPLIVELAPTIEKERDKRAKEENERNQLLQPPRLPDDVSLEPSTPRHIHK